MERMGQWLPCTILDGVRQLRCDGSCYFFSSHEAIAFICSHREFCDLELTIGHQPSLRWASIWG